MHSTNTTNTDSSYRGVELVYLCIQLFLYILCSNGWVSLCKPGYFRHGKPYLDNASSVNADNASNVELVVLSLL